MEKRAIKIKSSRNSKISINVIPGHFATSHSHVDYYVDMTSIKHQHIMAESAANEMTSNYMNTPIDTVICMDGTEVIGAFFAKAVSNSHKSINENSNINVITPEFNPNGQILFRDNVQPMIMNKKVVLMVSSVTTGKTIKRAHRVMQYYGGEIVGISSIFSAADEIEGVKINTLFKADDLPSYETYSFDECPFCKKGQKIDAIVNGYGYSRI
ncbi:MAG: orotate phosphoribosyltransferase [Oscillospiraceae bacterium]|nr:orotate phosphoribosyltransferase [Oscillospiraceae bacterium]